MPRSAGVSGGHVQPDIRHRQPRRVSALPSYRREARTFSHAISEQPASASLSRQPARVGTAPARRRPHRAFRVHSENITHCTAPSSRPLACRAPTSRRLSTFRQGASMRASAGEALSSPSASTALSRASAHQALRSSTAQDVCLAHLQRGRTGRGTTSARIAPSSAHRLRASAQSARGSALVKVASTPARQLTCVQMASMQLQQQPSNVTRAVRFEDRRATR